MATEGRGGAARRSRRILVGGVLLTGLAVALLVVWWDVADGGATRETKEWAGHFTAIAALLVFTLIAQGIGRGMAVLVVGEDNRVSTGRLQALAWTYAIAAALLSIIVSNWAGAGAGYDNLVEEGLKDEYLILLGAPFAAAIAARSIVQGQLEQGDTTKPPALGDPSLPQVFQNDKGRADLYDTQYLLFNFIALIFFLVTFVLEADDALPDMPDVLVGLTSLSAAGYVSNKVTARDKPILRSIVPPSGPAGSDVTIFGQHLLIPRVPKPEPPIDEFDELQLYMGDKRITTVARRMHDRAGNDKLVVEVPQVQPGTVQVVAYNSMGVASDSVTFQVTG